MNLLIIEDNKETVEFLRSSLKEEGFVVDVAEDGETGSYKARINKYDLIILDPPSFGRPKRGKEFQLKRDLLYSADFLILLGRNIQFQLVMNFTDGFLSMIGKLLGNSLFRIDNRGRLYSRTGNQNGSKYRKNMT